MSVTAKVRPGAAAPAVTHDELVARARELAPIFFERAAETEKLRRMPDANVAALKKAGLFKVLQARRYGGYQMPLLDPYRRHRRDRARLSLDRLVHGRHPRP